MMFELLLVVAQIRFEAVGTGPEFVLEHSPTTDKHMIETMPGGLAVFDANGDGRPDLFFTNGASLPSLANKFANRLYRNDGNWKFTDVTKEAGLEGAGYSMGAAAGDFDNDGDVDLFVAGLRSNHLYRNDGKGKFEEITAGSGILSNEWSVAAGWFDYDGDGLLDLLVTNYGAIDLAKPRFCGDAAKQLRVYCHPRYYDPRPNQLYRNLGGGKFADVSLASGVAAVKGRGMSIAFGDADGDGKIDAFVTNDGLPNFLFRNLGKGKFEEVGLLSGVALLDNGKPVASMGTDFRDYDNDGRPDVVVTALNGETFPLFRNAGGGQFVDQTSRSQLGRLSNRYAGWGVGLVDFDNDGWKDLFTANAHVNDVVEKVEAATYKQANAVFRNAQGKFEEVDAGLRGSVKAHRGAAFADLDGDGRVDAVVTSLGDKVEMWRNVSDGGGKFLTVKLRGTRSNRDGIGAVVQVAGQTNAMTSSVSYASSVVGPVHFGLGAAEVVETMEVLWPSGRRQTLKNVKTNQTIEVVEP
ncbi:MAG: CRTAC1 family protein [Acidobacteria bacterium]|nr:CRTAC1 family protein [Acidobacteriota bacterium]